MEWGAGDRLLIQVRDNVGVKAVRVLLDGEIGMADPMDEPPGEWWCFAVGGRPRAQVEIVAEDWMGNVGERTMVDGEL